MATEPSSFQEIWPRYLPVACLIPRISIRDMIVFQLRLARLPSEAGAS